MRTLAMLAVLAIAAAGRAEDKRVYRLIPTKDLKVTVPETAKIGSPGIIASAKALEKSPVVGAAAEALAKQIDFDKEKLVVLAWSGSGGDKVMPDARVVEKRTTVIFTHTSGKTFDLRQHLFLYAVPKDADVKIVLAR